MKKTFSVLAIIGLTLLLAFTVLTMQINAGGIRFAYDVTPTTISPDALTSMVPTSQLNPQDNLIPAGTLLQPQELSSPPAIDLQKMYPIFPEKPSSESILETKLSGILIGNGILRSIEPPIILHGEEVGLYKLSDLAWQEWTFDSFITIWSGTLSATPSQGLVWVEITPHYGQYQDRVVIQNPAEAGKLTIIGAVGERLILSSEQGNEFYFDVPGLSFVDSLQEEVPAVISSASTNSSDSQFEDAPDLPIDAFSYQQINTPLDSFINTPNDYDWFHFYSGVPGDIKVSMIPRTGNFGLKVVLVDDNQLGAIVEEDVSLGNSQKEITISNAPSGDYLVRVWSLDGSYSESQSYTVRFDSPEPEKVIPILECVTENTDGTFTAHFGYENPNPFVVVVNAKNHQNKFEPPPNFRTGQPESFVPGIVIDWFSVLFDGSDLTWMLDGHAVTANRNSPRCP